MSDQKRLDYVDYFRFFGILLMITGHVEFTTGYDHWIHAFHMPMWFFISGYLCNTERDVINHTLRRMRTIMVPYMVFAVMYIVIYGVCSGEYLWMQMLYPNYDPIKLNGALWFLPALFLADMIAYPVLKYARCWVAISILMIIAVKWTCVPAMLPLSLDSALVGVGFYAIGYGYRFYASKWFNTKLIISIPINLALLVIASMIAMHNGYVNMRVNTYATVILFWIAGVGITVAFFNIFRVVFSKINLKLIKGIGKNSIIYVCMNQLILKYAAERIHLGGNIPSWVNGVMLTVIVITVCYVADKIISATPIKVILGK